jgi:hypothetical protein
MIVCGMISYKFSTQSKLHRKLGEEYYHKASLGQAFRGYRKYIDNLDEECIEHFEQNLIEVYYLLVDYIKSYLAIMKIFSFTSMHLIIQKKKII